MLAQGQAQWGAQYIPNIQSFYIDKDPAHRHYWFPATLNVSLFPNLKNSLLSNVAVRKAISLALTASTDKASTGTASASAPAVASRPGSGGWPRRRPGRGACRAPRRRGR